MNTTHELQAVISAYFSEQPKHISLCGGGLINKTYKLDFDDKKIILQQLSSLFNRHTIQDFKTICRHLEQRGWETQTLIPTLAGQDFYRGEGETLWRALSYIPGTDAPEPMTLSQLEAVGKILGQLHADLQKMHYLPQYKLPHFHDTAFYARALMAAQHNLPTQALQKMAAKCLAYYKNCMLPNDQSQLIHGDPRTTNILFRNDQPVCYIDFDTLMYGSPWIDIGDILRSISGSNDQTKEQFSLTAVERLMRGYYSVRQITSTFTSCIEQALQSMQVVSLELAMRFLADVVHDNYFGWDNTAFTSRRENNIARAQAQLAIYERSVQAENAANYSPTVPVSTSPARL